MPHSLKVLDMLENKPCICIKKLHENSAYFREGMEKLVLHLVPGEHPIIPVMLGDAKLATQHGG